MKKLAIVTSAAFLMFTAALNAQTDSTKQQPVSDPAVQQQTQTQTQTQTATPANKDKYNNWTADTYKMQPMPEALTTEKVFPVIGKYQLTDKDGASSTVTVSVDPENKGLIWVEGLPQGKIKATLRKSPATYKIPVQPLEESMMNAEDATATDAAATETKTAKTKTKVKEVKAKELPEGVLIYDKDANVLNVCIGCTYKAEDPASAFVTEQPEENTDMAKTEKKTAKTTKKPAAKVAKVKPIHYTGSKVVETTAAVDQ